MDLQSIETIYGVNPTRWVIKRQLESGSRYMIGFGSVAHAYTLGGGYVAGYSVQVFVNSNDTVLRYSVEELEGYDY